MGGGKGKGLLTALFTEQSRRLLTVPAAPLFL